GAWRYAFPAHASRAHVDAGRRGIFPAAVSRNRTYPASERARPLAAGAQRRADRRQAGVRDELAVSAGRRLPGAAQRRADRIRDLETDDRCRQRRCRSGDTVRKRLLARGWTGAAARRYGASSTDGPPRRPETHG